MKSIVVLQARTSSTRLPAKVLLPIKGIPMVVLAAKRAGNAGRNVIVATSEEASDDALVSTLQEYGISYFRGSLANPLSRIVAALVDYSMESLVFRLTADNVFPDGELLDKIEEDFLAQRTGYLCCNGFPSGLPYGMSVEVMRLCSLREAHEKTGNEHDKEHVTPFVVRKHGENYFKKYHYLQKGHFRCTVDSFDDYLTLQQVFKPINNPVLASSFDLIAELEKTEFAPQTKAPVPKLIFGAAQLGMNYGVANITGQPSRSESVHLIKIAVGHGVEYIDTAHAYGNSEAIIGQAMQAGLRGRLKAITKLSILEECPNVASQAVVNAYVDASIYRSCSSLQKQALDVVMLHRASYLNDWNRFIWKRLLEHKASSVIKYLGVSIQNTMELKLALNVPEINYIQMPLNILDWRWENLIDEIKSVKLSRKLVIHARSVFLQGLLLSNKERLWENANVNNGSEIKQWLDTQVVNCNRSSVADLCLNYVNSLEWIDGLTVGMETFEQLQQNLTLLNASVLTKTEMQHLERTRPILGDASLDPVYWGAT